MIFLACLLIAHLLGDFVLQPDSWVRSKLKSGIASYGFWLHILTHSTLLLLIGFVFPQYYLSLIIIAITHGVIDAFKIFYLQHTTNSKDRIVAFIVDQLAHLAMIIAVVSQTSLWIDFNYFLQPSYLFIFLGYLFITLPAASIIKVLLSSYSKVLNETELKLNQKFNWKELFYDKENNANQQSLYNAGKYIGIIERILVYTFIIIGQWAAVGFLITAKSVFRFGDLNQGKNRQFTEYVLIGTLLSFGLAILVAIMIKFILNRI